MEVLNIVKRSEYVITESTIEYIFNTNDRSLLNYYLKNLLNIKNIHGDKNKFREQRYKLVSLLHNYFRSKEIGYIIGGSKNSYNYIVKSYKEAKNG